MLFRLSLLMTMAVFTLGLATVFQPAKASAVDNTNPPASKYCDKKYNGTKQRSCRIGYEYGKTGALDVTHACKGLKSGNLSACQDGYSNGARDPHAQPLFKPNATCSTSKNGCVDPAADPNAKCDINSCDFVAKYVNPGIKLLTIIFGVIAAGSLILGGIQFSTSEGDPQKASSAKNRIAGTIFAIFAYAFIWAFLQFIIPGGVFK